MKMEMTITLMIYENDNKVMIINNNNKEYDNEGNNVNDKSYSDYINIIDNETIMTTNCDDMIPLGYIILCKWSHNQTDDKKHASTDDNSGNPQTDK